MARGEAGPLEGVPFTAKDNLEAAGLPMAIGDEARRGVVAGRDATAVARLRAAGAVLVGKTNCPPYGGGIETDNPVYGRTANPYDLARTPGGSSGGEAAAIAAGCSALGVGTDSGASVRLPAHFCGLAALKPTAGLVPITGVLDDEGPFGALADPRTQVGPLARTVGDVALALALLAGPDGRDGSAIPLAPGDPDAVALAGLRVAVWIGDVVAREAAAPVADARGVGAREAAAPVADARGVDAREAAAPVAGARGPAAQGAEVDGEDAADARDAVGAPPVTAATATAVADAAAALREAGARVGEAAIPAGGHAITIDVWRSYGGAMGALELYRVLRRWDAFRGAMASFAGAYDLVLSPVFPRAAPRHGEIKRSGAIDPTGYTTPFSLAGWPAATVRAGTSPAGLPLGVQLAAPPWHDHVALAAAAAVERALGGFRAPPPAPAAR